MNTLLTINMITNKALALFRNSNEFLMSVNRQYDDSFAKVGAKIGSTLRIRLPIDPVVRSGATLSTQSITEQSVTLPLATQKGVDLSFTSAEETLSLDDYAMRILAPSVNNLAGAVATDLMNVALSTPNIVFNKDGSSNVISPTVDTWLQANAVLDNIGCPRGQRRVILSPRTQSRTVTSMAGLFNPTNQISNQFKTGEMTGTSGTLGFASWGMDQTVISHTTSAATGMNIDGASQTGTTLTVDALSAALSVGDIITIAGVNSVNRVTKTDTGELMQFVITAAASSSATTIHVYPALIPAGSMGAQVQYQTVVASPADEAAISFATNVSQEYRCNFVFDPTAFTFVTADLPVWSKGIISGARSVFDGISIRVIKVYDATNDAEVTRLDILYGYVAPRAEWACIVADVE